VPLRVHRDRSNNLVCREPTGDFGRKVAEEILILLKQLKTQFDKTIVMVTTSRVPERFVDTVYRLDKGCIHWSGKSGAPKKDCLAQIPHNRSKKYDEISDADFKNLLRSKRRNIRTIFRLRYRSLSSRCW